MTEQSEIKVLRETEVRDAAREKAQEHWSGMEILPESLEGVDDVDEYEYPSSSEHGRWDTSILPTLRRISGYGDLKGGTYNEIRDVAFIPAENEDDEPPVAEVIETHHILREVVMEAYDEKMYEILRNKVEEALNNCSSE